MLTWQNNSPRFELNGQVGDNITFHFGSTCWDDFDITVYYFRVKFVKLEERWTLYTELEQTVPYTDVPEPQVDSLVTELTVALEKSEKLDFRKYVDDWEKMYRDFSIVINGMTLSRPRPIVDHGYKRGGLNL
jgi:hypothetical protein